MALGGEVVDLVRLGLLDDADEVGGIRHVAVMQDEPLVLDMRVLVDILDPAGIERGGTALDAVDDIALVEQKLGEIGAILPGYARNQGDFPLVVAQ